jgi:signal transduction histidine kinase
MHQGEIWIKSDTGQGTTFFVRIPAFLEIPSNDGT